MAERKDLTDSWTALRKQARWCDLDGPTEVSTPSLVTRYRLGITHNKVYYPFVVEICKRRVLNMRLPVGIQPTPMLSHKGFSVGEALIRKKLVELNLIDEESDDA